MLPWAMVAQGDDTYYQVRFTDLNFTEGALPKEKTPGFSRKRLTGQAIEALCGSGWRGGKWFIGGATSEPWMQDNYRDEILAVSRTQGQGRHGAAVSAQTGFQRHGSAHL